MKTPLPTTVFSTMLQPYMITAPSSIRTPRSIPVRGRRCSGCRPGSARGSGVVADQGVVADLDAVVDDRRGPRSRSRRRSAAFLVGGGAGDRPRGRVGAGRSGPPAWISVPAPISTPASTIACGRMSTPSPITAPSRTIAELADRDPFADRIGLDDGAGVDTWRHWNWSPRLMNRGRTRRSTKVRADGIDDCRAIELPVVADPQGDLAFAEGESHVPFPIARVFYVYDVPARGGPRRPRPPGPRAGRLLPRRRGWR